MVIRMAHGEFFVIFLLVGCGEAFTAAETPADLAVDGGLDPIEVDAGERTGSGGSATGGAVGAGGEIGSGGMATGGAGAGGDLTTGGAVGAGGRPVPGEPPCCTDVDCPTALPVCTPWGTCGPGGDPYSCNYDFHCESYCYHCVGTQGGTCTAEKSCDCV
jgi:hypothetical protein